MLDTLEQARFEKGRSGETWNCPCCCAKIARVCEIERTQWPTLETKNVTGLKLAKGYQFNEKKRLWIKPQNPLPMHVGEQERRRRQDTRAHLQDGINNAEKNGDLCTVVYNQQRLAELGTGEARLEEVDISERLPALIMCPNSQCKRTWLIPSVRGVTLC